MTPSQFRKANPHLSDRGLAIAYANAERIDPDGARAREAFERWDKVLMGERLTSFVFGVDWAKTNKPERSENLAIYAVKIRDRWSIAHKGKGAQFGLQHQSWDVWCEHHSGALLGYVGNGEEYVLLQSEQPER